MAWSGTILVQISAVYVPFLQTALKTVAMSWSDWGLLIMVALPVFLVLEAYKIVRWFILSRSGESV